MQERNITAVVVTYNAELFIEKCIGSLYESTVSISVVVVDNQSSDKTTQIITSNFPQVKLIKSAVNLGFGKANNIGISWALSNYADFIFLLNQDAWIEKNALSELINIAETYPDYGILSPIHFGYDKQIWHRGFSKYVEMFAPSLLTQSKTDFTKSLDVYEVDFVPAALWVLRSAALRKVGGFDPIYFMYGEDNDLAARVRLAGLKIGIVPSASGHHMEKDFSGTDIPLKRLVAKYFSGYSAILKYSKHNGIYRYLSIIKAGIKDAWIGIAQAKIRKVLAISIALWTIFISIDKIEKSRNEIASEGAFLEICN
ncbi:MAG: glycosyltransferase family 2 protein [Synechococcales cyanobacterium M58_A2018_015]|nr:glycosyltransferase family 2 protein [Synechococcales cyanobacterium M58_A2018_015]